MKSFVGFDTGFLDLTTKTQTTKVKKIGLCRKSCHSKRDNQQ